MRNFRRVRPEDFDVKQLEKLCHEGKLYVSLDPDIDNNAYGSEVLGYVRRINAFATEDWEGNIDNLWNAIVEAPCFKDILMMKMRIAYKKNFVLFHIANIMIFF